VPGIILCALAAGVKSPAALGVLFLGWVWAGPGAPVRRRVAHKIRFGFDDSSRRLALGGSMDQELADTIASDDQDRTGIEVA